MSRYEALKHAVKAHAGQVDKCGQPYILHPIAVAEATESVEWVSSEDPEDAFIVALLHDVREDTDHPLDTRHFTNLQLAALLAITRGPTESYGEYIETLCLSRIACIVKLADLWHNLQPERQSCLPSKEAASLEKRYLKARGRIWEAIGYEWWPGEGDKG